ncbi:MAG: putative lipid II flippase FtsW [Chloroflexi bacterium]|nr:MAG: putative lipid II flippase FtsW [Chloroflexota bacterium]
MKWMNRHSSLRARALVHEPDGWLLALLTALVTFGTLMVYSASFPDGTGEGALGVLLRQLLFVAVGATGLLIAMRIDYHRYAALAFPAMVAALLLLAALVLIPGLGTSAYGAKRWIDIGPVTFQPSELAKPVIVLYMATWMAGKRERVRSFSLGLVQFAVIMGLLIGLVMLEPDLGTSILIATIGVAIFLVAGAELVHFGILAISGSVAFLTLALSASYRRDRLLVFLNPDGDIQNLGWQLYQARLALGSGGLFGVGLGASTQKFAWLPAAHNDAIFAVVGEELGLLGCTVLLGLFVAVAYRGYRIAMRAPDALGALIAVGITTWIVFQAAFNIGGVTLAIPFTGIPLPFISAGGTSLVVAMCAMGVLLNISRQTLSDAELHPVVSRQAVTAPAPAPNMVVARQAPPQPAAAWRQDTDSLPLVTHVAAREAIPRSHTGARRVLHRRHRVERQRDDRWT